MATTRICLINQKGGCGKSSCCFHLAGCLVELGLQVLLVDTDPQGSLSQACFGSKYVESMEAGETLAALFDEDRVGLSAGRIYPPRTLIEMMDPPIGWFFQNTIRFAW